MSNNSTLSKDFNFGEAIAKRVSEDDETIAQIIHDAQWAHSWEQASAVEKECIRQVVRALKAKYDMTIKAV